MVKTVRAPARPAGLRACSWRSRTGPQRGLPVVQRGRFAGAKPMARRQGEGGAGQEGEALRVVGVVVAALAVEPAPAAE